MEVDGSKSAAENALNSMDDDFVLNKRTLMCDEFNKA